MCSEIVGTRTRSTRSYKVAILLRGQTWVVANTYFGTLSIATIIIYFVLNMYISLQGMINEKHEHSIRVFDCFIRRLILLYCSPADYCS